MTLVDTWSTSDIDLAALTALAEGIGPRLPWENDGAEMFDNGREWMAESRSLPARIGHNRAALIVAAVNALPGLLAEVEHWKRLFESQSNARVEVEDVLDKALGPNEEDGAGEGLAADVALVVQQRDHARAEAVELRREVEHAQQEIEQWKMLAGTDRVALAETLAAADAARDDLEAELAQARRLSTQYEDAARLANRNTVAAASERDEARAEVAQLRGLARASLGFIHSQHAPLPLAECQAAMCRKLREAVAD